MSPRVRVDAGSAAEAGLVGDGRRSRPCVAGTFEHAFAMIAGSGKPGPGGAPSGRSTTALPSLDTSAVATNAIGSHGHSADGGRMSAMSYSGKVHPGGRP